MRRSTAVLSQTRVRLSNLEFPCARLHVHRTRLVFIDLDNLLHFAKMDREGRLDGFAAAYLPEEVILLLIEDGEAVTAVSLAGAGRSVVPMAAVLDRLRGGAERGELVYGEAPREQLAWMYASCAAPATPRWVGAQDPALLFPALRHERFTGVLELIADGRVSYFRFADGQFQNGYYSFKGLPNLAAAFAP